jgi:hypothetical protein
VEVVACAANVRNTPGDSLRSASDISKGCKTAAVEEGFRRLLYSTNARSKTVWAQSAIYQIGTNAIPTLLDMLQINESTFRSGLVDLLRKQTFIRTRLHTTELLHTMALNGFEVLGPLSGPAIPVLTNLLSEPEIRGWAAPCLGRIGPAARVAVPILIPWLTSRELGLRAAAAESLGRIGSSGNAAETALLANLHETIPPHFTRRQWSWLRSETELALCRLDAFPDDSVPILIQELRDDLVQGRFPRKKVEVLGLLGIRARPALPFLLQFLSKRGDETGEISKSLKRIQLDASNKVEGNDSRL